jgi:hypothetical protein
VSIVWVKCERPKVRQVICLAFVCLLAAPILLWICFPVCTIGQGDDADNPNHFYLFGSDSSFTCGFRYDPRAADLWMFRSSRELGALATPRETEKIWTKSAPE